MNRTNTVMSDTFEQLAKKHNGVLTYNDLSDAGLTKRQIRYLLDTAVLLKAAHGIYYHRDYFADDMYIFQIVNSNVIYSHETAAYLQKLTDRYPRRLMITTHQHKHLNTVEKMNVFYVNKDI